ncbi:MAG: cell envelope integrity protein CreD [Hyphomicrobiales bacterium]
MKPIKIVAVLGIMLALWISSVFVYVLIAERQNIRDSAIREVSSKWGNSQEVTGPYISVPYKEVITRIINNEERVYTENSFLYILPAKLNIKGELLPEQRQRGIYDIVVYESDLHFSGNFNSINLDNIDIDPELLQWDKATLNFGMSDLRGIQNELKVKWNNNEHFFNPGISSEELAFNGVSVPVSFNNEDKHSFDIKLNLNGSKKIYFEPIGKVTSVNLKSSWSSPKFCGEFLPKERNVDDNGFTANWKVHHLNRNYPHYWIESSNKDSGVNGITSSRFGVELLLPIDNYRKTSRVSKYAILIIVLTFVSFLLQEIMQKRQINPIQYLLVGLALIIFYTLLLSFSEHMVFDLAYLLAMVLTISLICTYVGAILKSKRFGLLTAGVLTIVYGFIFVIIQLENYALLVGSLGLFIILGLIMYVTRNIDWNDISSIK